MFEQNFVKVSYSRELYNGIHASLALSYAQRFPLENLNHFSFVHKYTSDYTPNGMDLPGLTAENDNIQRHNSFRMDIKLHFSFGQKFISRPDIRIRTNESNYPELLVVYKKSISIKGFSDLNYDFLEAQLQGKIPMKLFGTLHYRFGGGGFPNNRATDFADYKHFYGNFLNTGGTDLLGFYTINYYRHSTNQFFAEAHLEHHFGGFLFNKIPGIRKLKLEEVLGFHFLYTPTRKDYYQVDAGIDNIFKILRVDFVAGFEGKTAKQFGARVGLKLDFSK